jgi:hypothetical protein
MALEEFLIDPETEKLSCKLAIKGLSEIASFLALQAKFDKKNWPAKFFWSIFWPTNEKGWPPLL